MICNFKCKKTYKLILSCFRAYEFEDKFAEMIDILIDIFGRLFLESNAPNDPDIIESSILDNVEQHVFNKLADWFLFIEMKSRENITINSFVAGLFILI